MQFQENVEEPVRWKYMTVPVYFSEDKDKTYRRFKSQMPEREKIFAMLADKSYLPTE